ncbi:MAG: HDOD domain-containing protein [Gammaproteobacteria bacterium]
MPQQPDSLESWLAFLGQAEIPVLRQTARELERQRADEAQLNARDVAEAVDDDPLLTAKLLRYLQGHKLHQQVYELVDVKQTLLMLGLETFFREVPAAPFVEDMLQNHRPALVQLLQTVRRAQRAAYYAYDWAVRLHDLHADEVYVSALLGYLSEMLMWCFNPTQMLEIARRQAADPTLRSADVQKQVLGFRGAELQHRLVHAWKLPELLASMTDPAQAHTQRVRNVKLASNLARHSANGWDNAALPDDYRDIGELLRLSPDQVMAVIRSRDETAPSAGAV